MNKLAKKDAAWIHSLTIALGINDQDYIFNVYSTGRGTTNYVVITAHQLIKYSVFTDNVTSLDIIEIKSINFVSCMTGSSDNNYVKIKHDNGYETRFNCMSGEKVMWIMAAINKIRNGDYSPLDKED